MCLVSCSNSKLQAVLATLTLGRPVAAVRDREEGLPWSVAMSNCNLVPVGQSPWKPAPSCPACSNPYSPTPPIVHQVRIQCTHPSQTSVVQVAIIVQGINDNSPVFGQEQYLLSLPELSPQGTVVDIVEATDLDGDVLFYHIDPENEFFAIKSVNFPDVVVRKAIDYDVVKRVSFKLIVVDTRSTSPPTVPSHSATATINIDILDVDNRPPWFQPCTEVTVGSNSKVCLGSGYTGRVNLTEKTEGILPLEPGPVFAIDGDKGKNELITYRILSGNEAKIFHLDENTGNIMMLKAADVSGPVVLTVLAVQLVNSDQYATTSVTFDVVIKSQHPPQFNKQQYEGFVSSEAGPNSLVMQDDSLNRPLRVQAEDADFLDGVNPAVRYEFQDGSDFTVTNEGFVLLRTAVSPGTVSVQIQAVDTTNGEFAEATVSVLVLPGATTAMPTTAMETTDIPTTAMATTDIPTTRHANHRHANC
ncbi:hypothetical protein SKAU_G00305860 [Synaphobranchus kaupii]|uniref:Cadherin domain-containing protein n=1 Tax=Synaphobranchus kaupii TaxID=118154 RepID=A0A9Q1IKR8_SYNKA|nr:hypothetical protein SKAU_G00305860 [Synaphobranchus kaupii]